MFTGRHGGGKFRGVGGGQPEAKRPDAVLASIGMEKIEVKKSWGHGEEVGVTIRWRMIEMSKGRNAGKDILWKGE